MFNLIKADLFKLGKSMAIKVSFFIMVLSALSITVISYLMGQGSIGIEVGSPASLLADVVMITLIGPVVASIYICGDFEHRTIHSSISSGLNRGTIMLGKGLVYFFLIAIMVLPYSVFTIIAFASGAEFGPPFVGSIFLDILANEQGVNFDAVVFMKIIGITLTMMVVYASQLSICVLLAFLVKNRPVLVSGIGIFFSMMIAQASIVRDSFPLLDAIFSYTPFGMGFKEITMDAEVGVFIKAITVSLIFMIAILIVTYRVFRRSEIK